MRSTPVSSKPSWAMGGRQARSPACRRWRPNRPTMTTCGGSHGSRKSWDRAAIGACEIVRATRSPPALSLLRRAHNLETFWRWRQSRAPPPARPHQPGASPRPELGTVQRSSHAATPPLRRMRRDSLFAKISATGLNVGPVAEIPLPVTAAEQFHSQRPRQLQRRAGFANSSKQKLKILIGHRRSPADSCIGRFWYA